MKGRRRTLGKDVVDEAGLRLTIRLARCKPRIITVPSELLAMLSGKTKKIVMNGQ